mmetsp:Transcript_97097/g.217261  ORF Transcript_97097/g.217261 Transcript_97097/m.217261 type:complete len:116 (+) Transcript_97097:40-387(+)
MFTLRETRKEKLVQDGGFFGMSVAAQEGLDRRAAIVALAKKSDPVPSRKRLENYLISIQRDIQELSHVMKAVHDELNAMEPEEVTSAAAQPTDTSDTAQGLASTSPGERCASVAL